MRSQPGIYNALGAQWDGQGKNFAVYSKHTIKFEFYPFDTNDTQ